MAGKGKSHDKLQSGYENEPTLTRKSEHKENLAHAMDKRHLEALERLVKRATLEEAEALFNFLDLMDNTSGFPEELMTHIMAVHDEIRKQCWGIKEC